MIWDDLGWDPSRSSDSLAVRPPLPSSPAAPGAGYISREDIHAVFEACAPKVTRRVVDEVRRAEGVSPDSSFQPRSRFVSSHVPVSDYKTLPPSNPFLIGV
jgi:hypothetical protein